MKKRTSFISYGKQQIDEDDIAAVVETLRSPFLTQGPKVEEFEQVVANYVGAKYAVAFSNGTTALHGACYAAGIGDGDEVITTPITFAATSNAVLYCGGTPIFADIDERTYNIDPLEIEKKITSKTKAIMPVDFTGQPVDIDTIMNIAEVHNLVVIQDGAHSLGADYKRRKVGSQAHMTMFSFHPVKPITTGEGGIITTNSEEYFEKLKLFRSHGISKTPYAEEQGDWYYEMTELGYNYRMNDIQAALGLSQMRKIDGFIQRRREIAALYNEKLAEVPGIILPKQLAGNDSGWHLYMIQLNSEELMKSRKDVFDEMRALNIGVHVHYIPVYWHPYYQGLGYDRGLCPRAEKWYEQAMTLPVFAGMTDKDVLFIVRALEDVAR
ncbi:UDP-4-amino-4,6-dideoxy-N-acetyl-beta-L-altrosamine transaminase [Sporosarcina sp. ANT_H38]|uniref:UDP-4-amino-4, 6-dideoxy-N-acetyl-beta-L-altrosamine transaminase n=1 Tax=Sporosarcina sp. ANT_H38 TaxID=2597358 RepID=UPI0011F1CC28|nr:UDP-4-amino-4,6-dideoxy-N-acetyl-beta-L-altrosamine transaminase [Sporosarcina sp. ANT_H38]KAA0966778.1 UDP-4-amino-4,6-dideoxy-N-acetyl-beta-L-altrosamine transaminase [Sporosarcina sp. ANT_H38]